MNKLINLDDLDTVSVHNAGESMPLEIKGVEIGVTLHILGAHSDAVRMHESEALKEYVRKQSYAERKGRLDEFQLALVEKLQERNVANAAVRVSGWSGLKDEFNQENLKKLFSKNPQWIDDVINFSKDLGK